MPPTVDEFQQEPLNASDHSTREAPGAGTNVQPPRRDTRGLSTASPDSVRHHGCTLQVSGLYGATVEFDFDDKASREAVIVGLAWRDLRRARWMGAFGSVVLDGGATLEASEVDALDQVMWTESGRMHEIAEGLQIDASTATRAVDRLVRRGLVERARDPNNGRFVQVAMTDEGRRVHGELLERRLEFVSKVLDQFDENDREVLVRLLPDLADAVTATLRDDSMGPVDVAGQAHDNSPSTEVTS